MSVGSHTQAAHQPQITLRTLTVGVHLTLTLTPTLARIVVAGGPGNTVLNFYLIDFLGHDGAPRPGWVLDYNPASRVRALAIKFRAPGRVATEDFTPEELQKVLGVALPRAERLVDAAECAGPDRACWF